MGHGPGAEWYARDKFQAAEQKNWVGFENWKVYVARCKTWWETDGRPMEPGHRVNGKAKPETKIRILQERIDIHPANSESVYHQANATAEQRSELKKMLGDLTALKRGSV